MEHPLCGTDHERYLGSGILTLPKLAQELGSGRWRHDPASKQERNELERLLRHQVFKPWDKQYHVPVDVSMAVWNSRIKLGVRRYEGLQFERLHFENYDELCIVGKFALLELARSSDAWGLQQIYGSQSRERWWVFDFFCIGMSSLINQRKLLTDETAQTVLKRSQRTNLRHCALSLELKTTNTSLSSRILTMKRPIQSRR